MNPANEPEQAKEFEQFVVFRLDGEEYAVPILSATEVVPTPPITPVPNAAPYIVGLINLRGKILPVLDLEQKFQLPRTGAPLHQHIMVAESEQKVLFGILVDQVTEVLKVSKDTIKPAPEVLKSKIAAEFLPGVIVLEGQPEAQNAAEPRVLLILDLQKILSDKNITELQSVQEAHTVINQGEGHT
ncbi:MAG TPA: chemotaxis protein CheW [Bacillota bacterium]|nr:chemotaxis protein CheW [Bacillota bacterium]